MKIEVGMLVRILPSSSRGDIAEGIENLGNGEIGRVVRFCEMKSGRAHWDLDIYTDYDFSEDVLEPINPDSEPADEDFQEDLKRWLDKKVTA